MTTMMTRSEIDRLERLEVGSAEIKKKLGEIEAKLAEISKLLFKKQLGEIKASLAVISNANLQSPTDLQSKTETPRTDGLIISRCPSQEMGIIDIPGGLLKSEVFFDQTITTIEEQSMAGTPHNRGMTTARTAAAPPKGRSTEQGAPTMKFPAFASNCRAGQQFKLTSFVPERKEDMAPANSQVSERVEWRKFFPIQSCIYHIYEQIQFFFIYQTFIVFKGGLSERYKKYIAKTTPVGEYLDFAQNDFDPEQYYSLAAISDGANKLLMLVLVVVIRAGYIVETGRNQNRDDVELVVKGTHQSYDEANGSSRSTFIVQFPTSNLEDKVCLKRDGIDMKQGSSDIRGEDREPKRIWEYHRREQD